MVYRDIEIWFITLAQLYLHIRISDIPMTADKFLFNVFSCLSLKIKFSLVSRLQKKSDDRVCVIEREKSLSSPSYCFILTCSTSLLTKDKKAQILTINSPLIFCDYHLAILTLIQLQPGDNIPSIKHTFPKDYLNFRHELRI